MEFVVRLATFCIVGVTCMFSCSNKSTIRLAQTPKGDSAIVYFSPEYCGLDVFTGETLLCNAQVLTKAVHGHNSSPNTVQVNIHVRGSALLDSAASLADAERKARLITRELIKYGINPVNIRSSVSTNMVPCVVEQDTVLAGRLIKAGSLLIAATVKEAPTRERFALAGLYDRIRLVLYP